MAQLKKKNLKKKLAINKNNSFYSRISFSCDKKKIKCNFNIHKYICKSWIKKNRWIYLQINRTYSKVHFSVYTIKKILELRFTSKISTDDVENFPQMNKTNFFFCYHIEFVKYSRCVLFVPLFNKIFSIAQAKTWAFGYFLFRRKIFFTLLTSGLKNKIKCVK